MGASPGAAVALTKMNAEIDVRNVLPSIWVPSLVIHRKGDKCLKVEEGRFVASQIQNCKYVELDGDDHLPFVGNQKEILDEIEEFLTNVQHSIKFDRVLATVLSIKIIDPHIESQKFVDGEWQDLIEKFRVFIKRQLEYFKGNEISFDENGLLATFDGPARTIRCAATIRDSVNRLGVGVKIGLHTGECDVFEGKYSGFAVELAEKISQESSYGNILVSRTVKDLVAGSGISFQERIEKSFPEIEGKWGLFYVNN
jgi:class 3 adenylate cyclase